MAYQYYQQNAPGWGTSQFAFGSPPPLGYSPLDTWGGLDYYRAHVMARGAHYDPAFYQNAVSRVAASGAAGSGLFEAEHWHRHAFGGIGELTRMLPAEVGAAAAYEAWRQFRYNMSQYGYLSPFDQRREALTGLAIAEAVRLWQDTGRGFDTIGAGAAGEAAATTVTMILAQTMNGSSTGITDGVGAGAYYRGRRPSGLPYQDMDAAMRGRALSRSPIPGAMTPSGYAGTGGGMGAAGGLGAAGSGIGTAGGMGTVGGMDIAGGLPGRAYDDGDAYLRGRALSRSYSPLPGTYPSAYGSANVGGSPMNMPGAMTGISMPYVAGSTYPAGSYPYTNSYQSSPYFGAASAAMAGAMVAPGVATAPIGAASYGAGYSAPYGQAGQPTIIVHGSGHRHHRHRRHSHLGHRHHGLGRHSHHHHHLGGGSSGYGGYGDYRYAY